MSKSIIVNPESEYSYLSIKRVESLESEIISSDGSNANFDIDSEKVDRNRPSKDIQIESMDQE